MVVRIDKNFRHIFANPALYAATGLSPEQYLGKTNEEIGMPDELSAYWQEKHEYVFKNGKPITTEFHFTTVNKGERVFQGIITPEFGENDRVESIISIMRDITDIKKAELEKDALIAELELALSEVKTLRGFIPICANCKQVRDDKGYWRQIETYISEHSKAEFSHGMCPECMDKLYGDQDWYTKKKKKNL
jgi:PAS domain S-box-containing protein